jgi:hypothetical protein
MKFRMANGIGICRRSMRIETVKHGLDSFKNAPNLPAKIHIADFPSGLTLVMHAKRSGSPSGKRLTDFDGSFIAVLFKGLLHLLTPALFLLDLAFPNDINASAESVAKEFQASRVLFPYLKRENFITLLHPHRSPF